MNDNPVIDSARKAVGLDRDSIHAKITALLQSGMPDCAGVALGLSTRMRDVAGIS